MADRPLETQGWFYSRLSRAQAEDKLNKNGKDGSFLVRECENPKGIYVMSYRKDGAIFHSKIDFLDQKYRMAGGRQFDSVTDLVLFYTKNDGILTTDAGALVTLNDPLTQSLRSQVSWYHGPVPDQETRSRLIKEDTEDGSFLVRENPDLAGCLYVSVREADDVVNICIKYQGEEHYEVDSLEFTNLADVIGHIHQTGVKGNSGQTIDLKKPINKPRRRDSAVLERKQSPRESLPQTQTQEPARSSPILRRNSNVRADSMAAALKGNPPEDGRPRGNSSGSDSLENEPLYQVYHRNVVTRHIVQQVEASDQVDNNNKNGQSQEANDPRLMDEVSMKRHLSNILRQSRMGSGAMSGARQSCIFDVLKFGMGQLNLWRNIPEVERSGVLDTMDSKQKRQQEALFEIITSEASYLKSLNVLISHFYDAAVFRVDSDQPLITKQNHRYLFSNVKKVQEISKGLLQKLRALKKKNYILDAGEMAAIITEYAEENFEAYVVYSKNQAYQGKALNEMIEKDQRFSQGLRALEKDPKSQCLPFQSFLLLPVQRITRMPLLVDSVLSSMDPSMPGYDTLKNCFCVLQKIVVRCNEEAKLLADIEQVAKISDMLDFKKAKKVPLVSQHRHLVKEGEMTNLGPHTFGSTVKKPFPVYMFLFNDLLVITKRKGAGSFEVLESVSTAGIVADPLTEDEITEYTAQGIATGYLHMFLLQIDSRNVKCIIACDSATDQMRWADALTPATQVDTTVKMFDESDCPQAQAIQTYIAQQPDELSLEESDIVNVTMKFKEGWWQGRRIHDNQKGWFPSSVVVEIQSAHMRARNRRQQYRLLFGHYRLSNEFVC